MEHHEAWRISAVLIEGTHAFKAYGAKEISERHRHRYEFNNKYRELLTSKGLVISGLRPIMNSSR